jgi:2-succinyl-6-hydroxy-2,4-cyclohexadiene-1-carboxylate synthase
VSLGITLNCLHGFLGSADDWDSFSLEARCVKYDLFSPLSNVDPAFGLIELGDWVNTMACAQPLPRVLLGYSLGGRIALHALIQSPQSWMAAIIVSANLGFRVLDQSSERQERIKSDENWARKFETGQWKEVVGEWDAQPVFCQQNLGHSRKDSAERMLPVRFEKDFSRMRLANSLRNCSLGHQMDLRPALRQLQVPILWISGEQDAKYRSIAQEAAELNPRFKSVVIPGGGHRVPWEKSKEFAQSVVDYLGQLNNGGM